MNGVAKLTVGGQDVVLKFGLPAIRRIMEKMLQYQLTDIDEETKGETYNDLGLSHVLYAGYLNGCMMRDVPTDIPFEAFYTLLEDCAEDKGKAAEVTAAIACFEESKIVKQSLEKLKDEVEKKSLLIGTTSNLSPSENLDSPSPSTAAAPGEPMY